MSDECDTLLRELVDFAKKERQDWPESLKHRVRVHLGECHRCRARLLVEGSLADARSAAGVDVRIDDERVLARIRASLRELKMTE